MERAIDAIRGMRDAHHNLMKAEQTVKEEKVIYEYWKREKEKALESRTTLENNPTVCNLCERVFEILPVNMKEIEFANGEAVKVCEKCFNRIEARMPYKVAMN